MKVPQGYLASGRGMILQGYTYGANQNIGDTNVYHAPIILPFACRIIGAEVSFKSVVDTDTDATVTLYDDTNDAALSDAIAIATSTTPVVYEFTSVHSLKVHPRETIITVDIHGSNAADDHEGCTLTLLIEPVQAQ